MERQNGGRGPSPPHPNLGRNAGCRVPAGSPLLWVNSQARRSWGPQLGLKPNWGPEFPRGILTRPPGRPGHRSRSGWRHRTGPSTLPTGQAQQSARAGVLVAVGCKKQSHRKKRSPAGGHPECRGPPQEAALRRIPRDTPSHQPPSAPPHPGQPGSAPPCATPQGLILEPLSSGGRAAAGTKPS